MENLLARRSPRLVEMASQASKVQNVSSFQGTKLDSEEEAGQEHSKVDLQCMESNEILGVSSDGTDIDLDEIIERGMQRKARERRSCLQKSRHQHGGSNGHQQHQQHQQQQHQQDRQQQQGQQQQKSIDQLIDEGGDEGTDDSATADGDYEFLPASSNRRPRIVSSVLQGVPSRTGGKIFSCFIEECGRTYNTTAALMLHLNNHHTNIRDTPEGLLRCQDCGFYCRNAAGVTAHRRHHHQGEPSENHEEEQHLQEREEAIHEPTNEEVDTFCSMKLNLLNPAWVAPLQTCIISLLQTMATQDDSKNGIATRALFLLPGLIAQQQLYNKLAINRGQGQDRKQQRPVELLRDLSTSRSMAEDIEKAAIRLTALAPAARHGIRRRPDDTNREALLLRMKKKAETSVSVGRISVATRIIDSMEERLSGEVIDRVQAPRDDEVRNIISGLFPSRTAEDNMDDAPEEYPALELTHEVVREVLQKLKIDRAAGSSGWTNAILRQLATTGSEEIQKTFAIRLAAVFNVLLAGKEPSLMRNTWTRTRIALIPKDGNGNYRPIGIGEVLYRCMASAAIASIGPRVAAFLQPHQLAVGVPGGVEIAAVITSLGYEDIGGGDGPMEDFATMSVDATNAFGSVRRSRILSGLETMAPELVPFFKWMYGGNIALFDSRGTEVGTACTGCLQGDPLSSLYFAVALHPILAAIDSEMKMIDGDATAMNQGLITAIADDITVQARTSTLFRLAPMVERLLGNANLRINLSKSFIVGSRATQCANPPVGWTLLQDGGKTLGRPLGSIASQTEQITERLTTRGPASRALRRVSPRCALTVLRMSYAHRFDYLRKTTSSLIDDGVFRMHDNRIDACLHDIISHHHIDHLSALRALPIDLGGLGIPPLVGTVAARDRLITRHRTRTFLTDFHPGFLPVHNKMYYHGEGEQETETSAMENKTWARLLMGDFDANDFDKYSTAVRAVVAERSEEQAKAFHAALVEKPGGEPFAAQFLSACTPGAGQWIRAASYVGCTFQDADFREALRNRVLLPFLAGSGRAHAPCPCRVGAADLVESPTHVLVCAKNSQFVTFRHHAIRDKLAALLKKIYPTAHTSIEPETHRGVAWPTHRPDILFEMNGSAHYLDVVVAEPTGAGNRHHATLSSVTVPNGAALQAEERKNAIYINPPEGARIAPFALESTGRIGPMAHECLSIFCKDHPRLLRRFRDDVSHICASYLGKILSSCRRRLADRDNN